MGCSWRCSMHWPNNQKPSYTISSIKTETLLLCFCFHYTPSPVLLSPMPALLQEAEQINVEIHIPEKQ